MTEKNEKDGGVKSIKLDPSFFYEENGRIVFTEQYHLERGYCCGSVGGCRHCPYEPKATKGNTILKK